MATFLRIVSSFVLAPAFLTLLCFAPPQAGGDDILKPADASPVSLFASPGTPAPSLVGGKYLTCHIELSGKSPEIKILPAKIFPFSEFGQFVDAFVEENDQSSLDELEKLRLQHKVRWFEPGNVLTIPPPPPVLVQPPALSAGVTQIIKNGYKHLKGNGVLIAIIDSGIDYRQSAFRKLGADGNPRSRLAAYWDTTAAWEKSAGLGKPGPAVLPDHQPLGVVYENRELTEALGRPGLILPETLIEPDLNGHGTACAGIAAGSDLALGEDFAGVATESELIAIRVGKGPEGSFANAPLLNACCEWLDHFADEKKKPLVISCSFGADDGGRDGQKVIERHLSAWLARDKPGRILCVAAGNAGASRTHAELALAPGITVTFAWDVKKPTTGQPSFLQIYSRQDQTLKLSPSPSLVGMLQQNNPLSGSRVTSAALGGPGQMKIDNSGGNTVMTMDIYLTGDYRFSENSSPEFLRAVSNEHLIGWPGTSERAITVASFDFRDRYRMSKNDKDGKSFKDVFGYTMMLGEISHYSSGGPLRSAGSANTVKPTVAAPGQWFLAPSVGQLNKIRKSQTPESVHSSGLYSLFNGTSAATPYLAGVLALALEHKPRITQSEAEKLLKRYASPKLPVGLWGHGRLDYDACVRLLEAVLEDRKP